LDGDDRFHRIGVLAPALGQEAITPQLLPFRVRHEFTGFRGILGYARVWISPVWWVKRLRPRIFPGIVRLCCKEAADVFT
jgi:hypothetical protein